MDTILPSSVTYQISALVGKNSLDDYSIVGKNDAVQPVFMDSVTNDPDLTGLLVYLRGPERETVGEKVYYLLETGQKTGPDSPQSPRGDPSRNPVQKQILSTEQDAETAGDPPEEGPAETGKETPNLPERPEKGEIFIYVPRLDKGLPAFPFPDNLNIGVYSLVFEALGGKQTLYRMERQIYYIAGARFILDDIQSYLPGVSAGSYLIPPGFTVMLETRVTADERLDPYIVWYDGKRRITGGRIADGTGRLLWQAPAQTGFHTIRAEVFPFNPAEASSGTGNSRNAGRSSVPELRGKVKELVLPVSAKGAKPGFFVPGVGDPLYWYQFAGNLRDSMAEGGERDLGGGGDPRWVPSDGIYGLSVKSGDIYQVPRLSFPLDVDKQGEGRFLLRVKPVTEGTLLTASFNGAGSIGNALTMSIAYRDRSLELSLESDGLKAVASLPLDTFSEDPAESSPEYPAARDFVTVEAVFCVRENTFIAALNREGDAGFGRETLPQGAFQEDSPAGLNNLSAGQVKMELPRPLGGEINCKLGTAREQAPDPAKGSRNITSYEKPETVPSAGEPVPVSAVETVKPSAGAPVVFSAPPAEPYPLAIFDEFAIMFRNPLPAK